MKPGIEDEHGAKPSKQQPGSKEKFCMQDLEGKTGFKEDAVAPIFGREPESETESEVKEEDDRHP